MSFLKERQGVFQNTHIVPQEKMKKFKKIFLNASEHEKLSYTEF